MNAYTISGSGEVIPGIAYDTAFGMRLPRLITYVGDQIFVWPEEGVTTDWNRVMAVAGPHIMVFLQRVNAGMIEATGSLVVCDEIPGYREYWCALLKMDPGQSARWYSLRLWHTVHALPDGTVRCEKGSSHA